MLTTIFLSVFTHVVLVLGITVIPPSWKLVHAVLLGLASASAYDILVTPDAFVENSIPRCHHKKFHVVSSVARI